MLNGKIIGQANISKINSTSGVWSLDEQYTRGASWSGLVKSNLSLLLDPGSIDSYAGSGTSVYDLSGNGKTATTVNSPGYSLGSFRFTTGSNQYISCGNFGSFYAQGTISFWMNSSDVGNYRNPIHSNFQGSNTGFRFEQYAPNGFGMLFGNDGGSYTGHTISSGSLLNNTWYMVTVTWNTATNRAVGYLNNALAFDDANTTWPTQIPSLTLGNGFSSSPERWFSGRLGPTMLYSKQLTLEEVSQNYNVFKSRLERGSWAEDPFSNNLQIAMPFSPIYGISDVSANIRGNGTNKVSNSINSSSVTSTVKKNYYGSLDIGPYTSKKYVSVPNSSSLWLTNQDFTIEMWVYLTANNVGYHAFASHSGDTGDAQSGWVFVLENNNTMAFYASSGWALAIGSSTVPTANNWHHVAVSRSNNTTRMFLNGSVIATNTATVNISSPSSQTLRVGDYQWFPGGERGFSGYIQDFRLYVGTGKYTSAFTPPKQIQKDS